MAPRPRWLPRPFELVTFALALSIVLFLRWRGLRIDLRTVDFMAGAMIRRLPTVLLYGLVLQGIALAVARRSPLDWLRRVATLPSAWLWVRVWLSAMAMTYGYTWLKVSVPLVRHDLFDPQLWSLDRWLHLGISPSVFAMELVRGTPLAGAIDFWYGSWVASVLAMLAFVFLSPDLAERRHFALACGSFWLFGAWLYLALPALGPCYASPDIVRWLAAEMPRAASGQEALWNNYLTLVAGRDGTLRQFKPYLGVAAFPSLHVGAHWLFALWARRRAPRLFLPWAAATALTFFGSLATGWHYAVDGYAGMLLAWGVIRLADRFEPLAEPAVSEGSPGAPQGQESVGDQQPGDQRERDEHHPEGRLHAEHGVAPEQ